MKWREGDPVPEGYAIAKDGLPARDSGAWAREKLDFLDRYVGPAIQATQKKRGHTHYLDLFAGPGGNVVVDKETGQISDEFPGSPILALESEFQSKAGPLRFQNFHFFNRAEFDYDLLEKRIAKALERLGGLVDPGNVHHYLGDTNERIDAVLNSIPSWSYLFVFADIEGPSDLEFETLRALRGRHRSVDLYVLFPTGFIERVISYKPEQLAKHKEMLDRFFGTDTWLQIVGKRFTPSQAREMRAELLKLYQKQLRTIWKHADVVMPIRKDGQRILYHMILAHDHPTARKILNWASSKLQQLDLFGRSRG